MKPAKEIAAVVAVALLASLVYLEPLLPKRENIQDDTRVPPYMTAATETTAVPETTVAPETTSAPETTPAPETTVPVETTTAPDTTAQIETTAPPETTSSPETTAPPAEEYDYSLPVPEGESVGKDYFDDAVFIGNSRTRGFLTLAGLSKPGAYAYVGLTVDGVFTQPMAAGKTVINALSERKGWTKAYIMFGTNEIGWVDDAAFISRYGDIIDSLRKINPDVTIYIQSILPVSSIYTPSHPEYILYNMPKINVYNALLRELAVEKKVYFVNVAEVMTNSSGYLFDNASVDGVHINRDYCGIWLEYLMTHTVK